MRPEGDPSVWEPNQCETLILGRGVRILGRREPVKLVLTKRIAMGEEDGGAQFEAKRCW
jgi:hypothetical protein